MALVAGVTGRCCRKQRDRIGAAAEDAQRDAASARGRAARSARVIFFLKEVFFALVRYHNLPSPRPRGQRKEVPKEGRLVGSEGVGGGVLRSEEGWSLNLGWRRPSPSAIRCPRTTAALQRSESDPFLDPQSPESPHPGGDSAQALGAPGYGYISQGACRTRQGFGCDGVFLDGLGFCIICAVFSFEVRFTFAKAFARGNTHQFVHLRLHYVHLNLRIYKG